MRQIFIIAVNFEMCLVSISQASLSLSVASPPTFCLNDPSKNNTDAVDWRSLLARSASRVPGLMELSFIGGSTSLGRSILYIRTDESRASYFRGRASGKEGQGRNGIPVYELVTRDRSYETTGISRGGR